MKKAFHLFLTLWYASVALHIPCVGAETLNYQETTGTASQDITWEIKRDETLTKLTAIKPTETSVVKQDHTRGVTSWIFTDTGKGSSLRAQRLNDTILIDGTFKKKSIKRENKIDGEIWCQPVAFALIPFAGSTQKTLTFWSINQKNMRAFKMRAEKQGLENIALNQNAHYPRTVPAKKIKVSLAQGPASKLWHSYYWFHKDNGTFLKYQGSNGPPGTPETIILLKEPNP